MYGLVIVHNANIDAVQEDEEERLVPLHVFIVHDADQYRHRDPVGQAVSCERPPVERHNLEIAIVILVSSTGKVISG